MAPAGFGLPATEAALEAALAGVFLDAGAPIEIDAPGHGRDVATALAAYVARQKIDPRATLISFGLDPLGALARGAIAHPFGEIAPHLVEAVKMLSGAGFAGFPTSSSPAVPRRRPSRFTTWQPASGSSRST